MATKSYTYSKKTESKMAEPKKLDNNTIFARIPLYHKILKKEVSDGGNGNDGYEIADFLILKKFIKLFKNI